MGIRYFIAMALNAAAQVAMDRACGRIFEIHDAVFAIKVVRNGGDDVLRRLIPLGEQPQLCLQQRYKSMEAVAEAADAGQFVQLAPVKRRVQAESKASFVMKPRSAMQPGNSG